VGIIANYITYYPLPPPPIPPSISCIKIPIKKQGEYPTREGYLDGEGVN